MNWNPVETLRISLIEYSCPNNAASKPGGRVLDSEQGAGEGGGGGGGGGRFSGNCLLPNKTTVLKEYHHFRQLSIVVGTSRLIATASLRRPRPLLGLSSNFQLQSTLS